MAEDILGKTGYPLKVIQFLELRKNFHGRYIATTMKSRALSNAYAQRRRWYRCIAPDVEEVVQEVQVPETEGEKSIAGYEKELEKDDYYGDDFENEEDQTSTYL